MKKNLCLCVLVFLTIYLAVSFYRGINLSKQIDKLTLESFDVIEIIKDDTENRYEKGTIEYEECSSLLSNIWQSISINPEAPALMKGDVKEGLNIILYNSDKIQYKLYIGYAPSKDIIDIQIFNKNNFSITRRYYIEPVMIEKVQNLWKEQQD